MSVNNGMFEWVTKLARIAVVVSLVFLALALVGGVAGAIVTALNDGSWLTVALWALSALASLALGVWVFVAYGVLQVVLANERAVTITAGAVDRAETLLQDQAGSSRKLVELAALSDQAKSLIYREAEIDTISEAIHEDILRQDYPAAEAMIDAVEKKLGYVDIAARLREEVDSSRKRTHEEKIDAAVARLSAITEKRDWARAMREAQRLLRMFPDNPKVQSLPAQVTKARSDHKKLLLDSYDEAVKKNDVDKGIELLKELDLYLTPQEAAALRESARGVFKTKLYNMGVRFAIAVSEEQWADALATGQQIVEEYPNSRMAHEVRAKLELLRTKAVLRQVQDGLSLSKTGQAGQGAGTTRS